MLTFLTKFIKIRTSWIENPSFIPQSNFDIKRVCDQFTSSHLYKEEPMPLSGSLIFKNIVIDDFFVVVANPLLHIFFSFGAMI